LKNIINKSKIINIKSKIPYKLLRTKNLLGTGLEPARVIHPKDFKSFVKELLGMPKILKVISVKNLS